MCSSDAKASRRENCRPNVVVRVFALVPHQDASHSTASTHVVFERLKIEHLLKEKLLRAFLVGLSTFIAIAIAIAIAAFELNNYWC